MVELRFPIARCIGTRTAPMALLAFAVAAAQPAPAWARRAGIAVSGCDGCHSGGKTPTVTLTANPPNPNVGQAVTLTITVSQTNGPVAGFFLTTEDVNKGTFRAIEPGTLATAGGVTHTTPRAGSGGVTTFKAEWSASVMTGANFQVFALSANGDGTARSDAGGSATLGLVTGCTGITYYMDQDGDGFGTSDLAYPTRKDCTKPVGFAAMTGDCDDFHADIHPGATEQCDGKDNNCDGRKDEAVVYQNYCEDKDGDGFGVTGFGTKSDCAPSVGFGACTGDCNDFNKAIHPGAAEICDGFDNNCNGNTDEGVRMTCGVGWCRRYADGCSLACTPGPPAVETCNYFDDDCDGMIDNGTDLALCGAAGMACVLGQCIPDDGGAGGVSGGGGTGGRAPTGGRSGGGGAGTASGGAGGTPAGSGANTGANNAGGSGGGGGGCAVAAGPVGVRSSADLLSVVLLTCGLGLQLARRRRAPLSARRPPR